jgi:hypothetical protein
MTAQIFLSSCAIIVATILYNCNDKKCYDSDIIKDALTIIK